MTSLFTILGILFMLVAGVIVAVFGAIVLVKGLTLIGKLIGHVVRFVLNMIGDSLRAVGAVIMAIVLAPLILLNVVIGRWSASAHFGRAFSNEIKTCSLCLYRVVVGHPFRLIGLAHVTEGLENRLPQVIAEAPGSDKPSKSRVGMFDGYTIVGSLPGGGSGAKLYVAQPDELKRAGFARQGAKNVDQVVIKCFSLQDGSSLPQIVRESRALDAAKKLGLVLEHELTDERFYYAMPYVPGESLTAVTTRMHGLSSGPGLDDHHLRQALGYIADLLRSLETYHRGGLWHKDVKPDNIIVDGKRAHLVDFGLVTPLRSAMTLTTHGTEYFRDPELVRQALRGVKVHQIDGTRFDIYAAGAVLFSVIENSFPAHGGLSQITRRCPESVRWIVRRAMTDYDKRYATASDMLGDLESVLQAPNLFGVRPADLASVAGEATESLDRQPIGPWLNVKRGAWREASPTNSVHKSPHAEWVEFTQQARHQADEMCRGCWLATISEGDALEWLKEVWVGEGASSMHNRRLLAIVRRCAQEEADARATSGQYSVATPIGFAAAGTPVPPPMPRQEVPAAREELQEAVVQPPSGRPNLKVNHWWSGRYAVAGVAMGASAIQKSATPPPVPPVQVVKKVIKSIVPPSHRAKAAEQVRSARARAAAKRRAAHQRVSEFRSNSNRRRGPSDMNAGLVAGLAVALFLIAVLGAGVLLFINVTRNTSQFARGPVIPLDESAPIPMALSRTEAQVLASTPVPVLPGAGDRSLGAIPALAEKTILVASDLGTPMDSFTKSEILGLLRWLDASGASITGDGAVLLHPEATEEDTQVGLLAELKAARGQRSIDASDFASVVRNWLAQNEDIDMVLWLAQANDKQSGIIYATITRSTMVRSHVEGNFAANIERTVREAANGL